MQQRDYVQALLRAYRQLPDTPDRPRPPDRRLAKQLHDRDIPLDTVKDAIVLASARRLIRPPQAPQLSPIRSLYYFVPVIEELLQNPLPKGYARYLTGKSPPAKQLKPATARVQKTAFLSDR